MSLRNVAAVVVVVLSLSGCLSIETHISFDDPESGTITHVYHIDGDYIVDDAVESPSGELPLPVAEADARSTARLVEGLTLDTYERSADGDRETIEITFRFESITAMNAAYATVAGDEAIVFDGNSYRQRVGEGLEEDMPDDAYELLRLFVSEDDSIGFSVSFPDQISGVSDGAIDNGSRASLERSLSDVLADRGATYWEIELE